MTIYLAVSGPIAAGKDTFFESVCRNFDAVAISSRDLLELEAKTLGLGKDRDTLRLIAADMANSFGPGELWRRIAIRLQALAFSNNSDIAIGSGIRNLEQVAELRACLPNLALVSIVAPIELRYQRLEGRGRGDEIRLTFDEFKIMDEKELFGRFDKNLQVANCILASDYVIENSGSLFEFEEKTISFINSLIET